MTTLGCVCVQQAWFLEEVVVAHALVPVERHVLPADDRALLGGRRLGGGVQGLGLGLSLNLQGISHIIEGNIVI